MSFIDIKSLVIPLAMVALGLYAKLFPPKRRNWFSAYRTRGAKRSREAWKFAQQRNADLYLSFGTALLVLTFIAQLFAGEGARSEKFLFGAIMIQTIAIMVITLFTEMAINKRFDKEGKRLDGEPK